MNEKYTMRPGDTFVAQECGCSFIVQTGPRDPDEVKQAPRCCCGHDMVKVETPVLVQESMGSFDTPQPAIAG